MKTRITFHRLASYSGLLGLLLLSPLAAQNVGIGTATPSNRLHVHAAAPADANGGQLRISESANNRYMLIGRAATYGFIQTHNNQPLALNPLGNDVGIRTTTPDGRLGILSGWGNWIGLRDQINNHLYVFHNPASGDRMEVGVYDASAATWRWGVMSITPAGNVGIGTTTPAQRLHVDGTVRVSTLSHADAFNRMVVANSSGDLLLGDAPYGYNVQSTTLSNTVSRTTTGWQNLLSITFTPRHNRVYVFASFTARLTDNNGLAQLGLVVVTGRIQAGTTTVARAAQVITDYDDVRGAVTSGGVAFAGIPVNVTPNTPTTITLQWDFARIWSNNPWQIRIDPAVAGDHAVLTILD